jgi:ABC-type proline/glycine betaine transport system substrate-binding protein
MRTGKALAAAVAIAAALGLTACGSSHPVTVASCATAIKAHMHDPSWSPAVACKGLTQNQLEQAAAKVAYGN